MRRLVQFFIGSSIVFLAILSVFNLALFLETAKLAESGLDGSFMVEDVFPRLWSAFAVVGVRLDETFCVADGGASTSASGNASGKMSANFGASALVITEKNVPVL